VRHVGHLPRIYLAVWLWEKCVCEIFESRLRDPGVPRSLVTPWSIVLETLTGFKPVKKFHAFYGTRSFITAFTSARQLSMSWASPGLRHQFVFHNMIRFYGEELLAPRPTPRLEDHPLLAILDCLFSIFAAALHTGLEAVPPSATWERVMPWWQGPT
jgi:hypothetical protein